MPKEWSLELRAPSRRMNNHTTSRWLRVDGQEEFTVESGGMREGARNEGPKNYGGKMERVAGDGRLTAGKDLIVIQNNKGIPIDSGGVLKLLDHGQSSGEREDSKDVGLSLVEDRKRKRSTAGLGSSEPQLTDKDLVNNQHIDLDKKLQPDGLMGDKQQLGVIEVKVKGVKDGSEQTFLSVGFGV
ncbi:hypothetical protein PTKIN_Ptkin11bG0080300 [Pterospermum kingtungense]